MTSILRMASERTPLNTDIPPGPSYVYPRGFGTRARQRQIRQFQCCICATFLVIFAVALVITISYTLTAEDSDIVDNITSIPSTAISDNETLLNGTDDASSNTIEALQGLQVFLLFNLPLQEEIPDNWTLPEPTQQEATDAVNSGKNALGDKEILEENIPSPNTGTPSFRHQKSIASTPEARTMTKRGYVENQATRAFTYRHRNTSRSRRDSARKHSIGQGAPIDLGQSQIQIDCSQISRIYRTANGSCNNKANPNYGASLTPFRRILNPDYADGIQQPRVASDGGSQPSARKVSLEMHRPEFESDPKFTVMMAVWGQFLDHDITATALNQGQNGQPIDCCSPEAKAHPECFPVPIGKGDPYYDEYNITCMGFIRSAPAPTGRFGPRQQLNQATAFIDGSAVYGSTATRTRMLRENDGGRLRMFYTADNRTLLPLSTDPSDGCNDAVQNAAGRYCFETGDSRANENLLLTSMHLIWARHHNHLAEGLSAVNPNWTDEKIFQEARKILGAQMQHITYSEFLPILFGEEFCDHFQLLTNNDTEDTYSSNVDGSIANSFAAAAFRFSHNLLPGLMNASKDDNATESIHLHTMLFNPFSLWHPRGVDEAVASAVDTSLSRPDSRFTTELTERLFQAPSEDTSQQPCGLDLVSLNIQRGRDHGLPGYPEWRKKCGLPPVESWESLETVVGPETTTRLQKIYRHCDDIDVYTGALLETPQNNSLVGPTLLCMLGDQFVRLKEGDAFWYERTRGPQRFTPAQRQQIRKTTLAGVICANADAVQQTQKKVMERVSDENPITDCGSLDTFDFEQWKDKNLRGVKVDTMQTKVSVHSSKKKNVTKPLD